MKQPKGSSSISTSTNRTAGSGSKVTKKGLATQKAQKLKRVREMLASKKSEARQEPQTGSGGDLPRGVSKADTVNKPSGASKGSPQQTGLSTLQKKMQQKLKGARFRWINEAMYTETGAHTFKMVQADPSIFEEYHQGFAAQVQKWPVNPVDIFIGQLQGRSRAVVADLGCGEAALSAAVGAQHTVHSFDLVAHNERITACNIADVPLPDESVDVAIFSLALMGTDFIKFVREASRILRTGGELKIAEVVSRIADVSAFVTALEGQGFRLDHKDSRNKMFIMLDLTKISARPATFRA
ncbi:25S rRNA (adenine645-N1)-methyltransferase, partial [Coemansia sp. RSA 353]